MIEEVRLFGLKMNPWPKQKFVEEIEKNIISRKDFQQVSSLNSAMFVYALKDPKLKEAINSSFFVNIDGLPLAWALRWLGYKDAQRASCPEIFFELLNLCQIKGYKPFFLGAEPEIIQKAVTGIKEKYPKIQIGGYHHGYFSEEEESKIADEIRASKSDMLFLGISSPKKELFVQKYLKHMNVPFTFGIGGVFDIIAGKTKRAPIWMQNCGLEWLYRLYQEPSRMWKRYLVTNTLFIYYILKAKWQK